MIAPVAAGEWSDPQEIVGPASWSGDPPSVVYDDNGAWHMVYGWIDPTGEYYITYRSSLSQQPTNLVHGNVRLQTKCSHPAIAVAPSGDLLVMYRGGDGSIKSVKRTNGQWSSPQTIVSAVPYWCGDPPSVVYDDSGAWHMVYGWVKDPNREHYLTYRNSLGEQYNIVQENANLGTRCAYPAIAIDLPDTLLVMYRGGDGSIKSVKRTNGQWSAPETIIGTPSSWSGDPPSVVYDIDGTWHMAYGRTGSTNQYFITYQNSLGGGSSFGFSLAGVQARCTHPDIAINKSGDLLVMCRGGDGSIWKIELPSHVPVVLIHGINSDVGMWDALTPALKKEGIPYWNFDYTTSTDPRETATELETFISNQRSTYRPDLYPDGYEGKIDIVCHSMGAIVSRWYMEPNGHGNDVRQWIGIAPAHGGSAGADLIDKSYNPIYGPLWWNLKLLFTWCFGWSSLPQLRTDGAAVQYLKTDDLSSSTTYRVIAGWNPTLSMSFGKYLLFRTRAKAADGTPYWTKNGDMIVAQAQSLRDGMGFECFPTDNSDPEGGNDEPAGNFDHTHIHHSPAVIQRVVKYLKNPHLPLAHNIPVDYPSPDMVVDPLQSMTGSIGPISEVVVEGFSYGSGPVTRDVSRYSSDPGTAETDVLFVDLNWTEGRLSLELTDPNGLTYTSATNTSRVWSTSDSNHILFTIVSPTAGNWSAKIIPLSLPDHPIGYNLTTYRSEANGTLEEETPAVAIVPGGSGIPTDTNSDGKCEDVNGNGRKDFADVVLYFNQMTWISANEPLSAFDYNGNGRIDFADVVWLFNHL